MVVEAVLCSARKPMELYVGELNDKVFRKHSQMLPNLRVKERGLKKTVVTESGVLELPKDLYVDCETRKSVAPVLETVASDRTSK